MNTLYEFVNTSTDEIIGYHGDPSSDPIYISKDTGQQLFFTPKALQKQNLNEEEAAILGRMDGRNKDHRLNAIYWPTKIKAAYDQAFQQVNS